MFSAPSLLPSTPCKYHFVYLMFGHFESTASKTKQAKGRQLPPVKTRTEFYDQQFWNDLKQIFLAVLQDDATC